LTMPAIVFPAVALVLGLAAPAIAQPVTSGAQRTGTNRRCLPPDGRAIDLSMPGSVDPLLTRLFTPPRARRGTYCAIPTGMSIERMTADYASREPSGTDTAWRVRLVSPLDAFGSAAPYDRPTVALLFGGQRIRLARGPISRDGRTVASITLASPYPDASLTRLMPGTLMIVYWIDDHVD
jgi:hypothetical protein